MTAIVKVSDNRLVCIVACDSATVLAKPSPQTSSSFSNVKHATPTTWYTVDEMGRGAREMVLDVVSDRDGQPQEILSQFPEWNSKPHYIIFSLNC